jgi:two-component system, NtrC family, response regulator AtoC
MYKILLVDDEQEIRECLEGLAKDKEFIFTHAGNGEEGLISIRAQEFDCIVSDIKMPVMDGLKMLEMMRAERKNTPIIFISGYASDEFSHKVCNYGAVKLLHKLELGSIKKSILEAIALGKEISAAKKSNDSNAQDFFDLINKTNKF